MVKRDNLIVIDSNEREGEEFLQGVADATGTSWKLLIRNSNDRSNFIKNAIRYFKYAFVPLGFFLRRREYETIITWQQFYGLFFAFYSRIFHVKKVNKLLVMTFIYKEKQGVIGNLYKKFFEYIVHSGYIDGITCVSNIECERFSKLFDLPSGMFHYVQWGLADYSRVYSCEPHPAKYIFSAGRSNRDWQFVFDALGNTEYEGVMVCAEGNYQGQYDNLQVLKNISDNEYYNILAQSYCVVLSIKDCTISAGQITLIQAMQFGKPVILTQSDGLTNDYVVDGENGLIVEKDKHALLSALCRLYSNPQLYERLSKNGKTLFENKFSSFRLGQDIGNIVREIDGL